MILFAFGLGLMAHQAFILPKSEFNWLIFGMGAAITQAPGAMAMISIIRTAGSSLPAASDAPPSEQESPSLVDSGDE